MNEKEKYYLKNIKESLEKLEKHNYDTEKFLCSTEHLVTQLEYFYCHLVTNGNGNPSETFYQIKHRPQAHQIAYFNIGRGFPKELMDGHWCYILKDLGVKMLVVPCTSIKNHSKKLSSFEKDIDVILDGKKTRSRLQLSDIRSVDVQRLDLRKKFGVVLTSQDEIKTFIKENLL